MSPRAHRLLTWFRVRSATAPLEVGAARCDVCGTVMAWQQAGAEVPPAVPAPSSPATGSRRGLMVVAVVGVIAVVAALLGGVWWLRRRPA